MDTIHCVGCGKPFHAKSSRSKFCGPSCQHKDWVGNNRDHVNKYQKAWRDANPSALGNYNSKRRKEVSYIACKHCGVTFQKHSGPHKFCSVRCRDRDEYKRPHTIATRNKWVVGWREKHREKLRAGARAHYRKHALRKHQLEPWRSILTARKRASKKLNIPFELNEEWAKARWTGKCELTGIDFLPPEKRVGYKNRNFSPSIDKIVPSLGYTQKNSRFVLWAVNSFKRDGTDDEMYLIAERLIAMQNSPEHAILSLPI